MYNKLGTLKQGTNTYVVATRKGVSTAASTVMFKTIPTGQGEKEVDVLRSLRHPSIVSLVDLFGDEDDLFIGLQECRYTLAEIVHVSLPLQESHIRQIATSVSIDLSRYIHAPLLELPAKRTRSWLGIQGGLVHCRSTPVAQQYHSSVSPSHRERRPHHAE